MLESHSAIACRLAHHVATEEAKLRLGVASDDRRHEMRGVQIATCLPYDEIVFHSVRYPNFSNTSYAVTSILVGVMEA